MAGDFAEVDGEVPGLLGDVVTILVTAGVVVVAFGTAVVAES